MAKTTLEEYQDFLAGKSHQEYRERYEELQRFYRKIQRYTSEDGEKQFTI